MDDPYADIIDQIAPLPRRAAPAASHLPDLISFVKEKGLTPGSTTGGRHNTGSKHYSGNAVDIKNSGSFSNEQVVGLKGGAAARGFLVRDERARPKGQKVWGGPHLHLEYAGGNQDPHDSVIDKIAPIQSADPYDAIVDKVDPQFGTGQPLKVPGARRMVPRGGDELARQLGVPSTSRPLAPSAAPPATMDTIREGLGLQPNATRELGERAATITDAKAPLRQSVGLQVTKERNPQTFKEGVARGIEMIPEKLNPSNWGKSEQEKISEETERRIAAAERAQSSEMIERREGRGTLGNIDMMGVPLSLRAIDDPAARALGGGMHALAGMADLFGLLRKIDPAGVDRQDWTPLGISNYLHKRAQVLEESTTNSPLTAEGKEIERGLSEKTVSAVGDLGLTIAEIIALKKVTGLPLGRLLAIQTALKTSNETTAERAPKIVESYVLGRALEGHLGRLKSAGLFAVPAATGVAPSVLRGTMSPSDAALQVGVQAAAGLILGGGKGVEDPRASAIEPARHSEFQTRDAGQFDPAKLIPTGETRFPLEGEWFIDGSGTRRQAKQDYTQGEYQILGRPPATVSDAKSPSEPQAPPDVAAPYFGNLKQGIVSGFPDPHRSAEHAQESMIGGERWRYEPTTKTVYWTTESPSPESKFTLEDWLDRHGQIVDAHEPVTRYNRPEIIRSERERLSRSRPNNQPQAEIPQRQVIPQENTPQDRTVDSPVPPPGEAASVPVARTPSPDAQIKVNPDGSREVIEPTGLIYIQPAEGAPSETQSATKGRDSVSITPEVPQVGERSFPISAEAAGLPQATDLTYAINTDRGATERANSRIESDGAERVRRELLTTDTLSKDDVVAGSILAHQFTADGDIEGAIDVIDNLAAKLTRAGQTAQAASLISRLTPEGVLLAGQRRLPMGQKLTTEQGADLVAKAQRTEAAEAKVASLSRELEKLKGNSGERPATKTTVRERIGTIHDRLAKLETDARQRLADRAVRARSEITGTKGQRGAAINPADVAASVGDWSIIGAAKIARSGMSLARWTEEMVADLGEDIRPHLSRIYKDSYDLYRNEKRQLIQEQRERGARKAEPNATDIQRVINDRLDAQTVARRERAELARTFDDLSTGGLQRFMTGAGDIAGLSRALETTADLSWGFRQGKFAFARHPLIWLEGFGKQKVALTEASYNRLLSEIELDPDYKYMQRGRLEMQGVESANSSRLAARGEEFASNLVRKIPVLKQSEMAYNAMGDWVKSRWFKSRLTALRRASVDLEAPESQRLLELEANLINNATGRGHLPFGIDRASPIINQVMYSARFFQSRLHMMAAPLDPRMWGVSVGSKPNMQAFPKSVRVETWKTLAAYYGVVGGQLLLLKAMGANVGTDPNKADFLKAQLGPIHIDYSAGILKHLRFIAHLTNSIRAGKQGQKQGQNQTPGAIVEQYLRTAESPNASLVHDIFLSKKDKQGYGTDFKGDSVYPFGDPRARGIGRKIMTSYLVKKHSPMVLSDILEAYQQMGWTGAAIVAPLSIGGESVNVYEAKGKNRPKPTVLDKYLRRPVLPPVPGASPSPSPYDNVINQVSPP